MTQPYSSQPSNRWSSSSFQLPMTSETPPPPPPKPDSHEASRRGTPQTGGGGGGYVAPPAQSQIPQGGGGLSPRHSLSNDYQYAASGYAPGYAPGISQQQVEPPRLEDEWLPEIVQNKTTSDLQSVLANPNLLSALSTLHPSYENSQQLLQSHLDANKSLTQRVLDLEARVTSLRATTESLLLTHQSLEVSWRKKQTEMDAALEPWSPKALYQRLAAAVAEQEAVCRAVEESFLEDDHQMGRATDKEVADWIRRIRTESARLESRKEARARWDEGRVGGWR